MTLSLLSRTDAAAGTQTPCTVTFDYSKLTVDKKDLAGTTPRLIEGFEAFCRSQQGRTRTAVMAALAGYQFIDDSSDKKCVGELIVTIPVTENRPERSAPSRYVMGERETMKIKKDPDGIVIFAQPIWN